MSHPNEEEDMVDIEAGSRHIREAIRTHPKVVISFEG